MFKSKKKQSFDFAMLLKQARQNENQLRQLQHLFAKHYHQYPSHTTQNNQVQTKILTTIKANHHPKSSLKK